MWLIRRKPRLRRSWWTRNRWPDSMPLFRWSRSDAWLTRDAYEGTIIFGATGSGKSTGSGETVAKSLLKAGFGGLVLTAKPGEREQWERYCREARRSRDLIVFSPDAPWRFNFLDYELRRAGRGAGLTENIVMLFTTILELAERNSGKGGGREDEGYWRRAMRQLVRNLVDLLVLSNGTLSIPELYRLVISLPASPEDAASDKWRSSSYCFQCVVKADKRKKSRHQLDDLRLVSDYILLEYPALSEKTRSIIVSTFTSLIDVLNRGVLRELFCRDTTVTPDASTRGNILLIDLPVKEYGEVGVIAQSIWKYCWQRSVERRNVRKSPRPAFLWADEAQNFFTPDSDMQFQATARSSRVATVYLVQNISSMVASLGSGESAMPQVEAILGNLNLKVFHANSDPQTNHFASTLIGRTIQYLMNASSSHNSGDWLLGLAGLGPGPQANAGLTEHIDFEVQESEFTRLLTGGRANRWRVGAIIFQNGKLFNDTGKNWRYATFVQSFRRRFRWF